MGKSKQAKQSKPAESSRRACLDFVSAEHRDGLLRPHLSIPATLENRDSFPRGPNFFFPWRYYQNAMFLRPYCEPGVG